MTYTELKIRLMLQGAEFTSDARRRMCRSKFGQITFYDYATTGGIVIEIDGQVYANVPVRFQHSDFRIDFGQDEFLLFFNEERLPVQVRIIPAPKYALDAVRLEDGTPVREIVMTHADRVRISPVHGCSFHCNYCTCNSSAYRELTREQLDAAFRIALNDPYNTPRHVLISGGTPKETEDSYTWLNDVYHYFPNAYPKLDFEVMLSPRTFMPGQEISSGYDIFLRFLHDDCGVKTMSVNLELYNEILRKKYIPEKYSIGMDHYELFIKNAVAVFGEGNIRSSLIVGLESSEDTIQGVKALVDWDVSRCLVRLYPLRERRVQQCQHLRLLFCLTWSSVQTILQVSLTRDLGRFAVRVRTTA